ncbi:MAG: helix-turn-helix transcriptional regulator [bacterium]|nr:helix-turn-helix transcriptional regulator [bacterium]
MKQELKQKIGKKLRKFREYLGLTQAEMVDSFDIGRANYSRIEKGEVFPNVVILHTLKNQFSVSLDWLIGDEGTMQPVTKANLGTGADFSECRRELDELFYHIKEVPMVKHAMLGFFLEYKMKNEKLIRKLVKEAEKKRSQAVVPSPANKK